MAGIDTGGIGLVVQLVTIAGIGYFAITYGPQILNSVNQQITASLGGGAAATPVSGTASTTTATDPLTQYLQSLGINTGSGGLGALNPGLPSAVQSAFQNTGGYPYGSPGYIPGVTPTGAPNYPYYTGAPQFLQAPTGTPNMVCTNGQCRSFVGQVLNGW